MPPKGRRHFLPAPYQFENFQLDLARYELRRSGRALKLERIPMELLILLVGRHGELVSRDEIIEKLWGRDVFIETELGINTAVRKIRQALGDDPERPRFVQTVVGKGYRFVAPVSNGARDASPLDASQSKSGHENGAPRPYEPTGADKVQLEAILNGAAIAPTPTPTASSESCSSSHGAVVSGSASPDPEKSAKPHGKRPYAAALFTAGTAATVIALLLLALGRFPRSPLLTHRITIAVLPFTNLSGDPAEEYLSDGMTEEVITSLGQVDAERLGVIARTSAMRYKRTDRDVRQIGSELGADYILEGSIRRAGDRIRVTAQLVQARDQTNLWSQDYDSLEFNDIPGVQIQIRNAVAKVLHLKTEAKLGYPQNVQPEAYQLYLKGRYFLDRRDPASLQKALDYFKKSQALDGNFARASASVALSYELLEYVRAISPADSYPNALSAAQRAVQIDPASSEAHTALAYIHEHYEWRWTEADRELTQALTLDPNYELARQWYSYELLQRGDTQRSLTEMRRALALDPVSFRVNVSMAERFDRAGRREEAIQQYLTALELSPDDASTHIRLAELCGKKGDVTRAASEYRRGLQLSGNQELEKRFDDLNARAGFTAAFSAIEAEKFRAALRDLDTRSTRGEYVSPSDYAFLYTLLGDRKQALAWLQRAYDEHASIMLELGSPVFDKLRDAPEFQEFLRQLNMPMLHAES
jgi:TolB-like protein/DNA-binding winged helix-turn-helix (wHTH) protein/Flp pilus assembly protein TadD